MRLSTLLFTASLLLSLVAITTHARGETAQASLTPPGSVFSVSVDPGDPPALHKLMVPPATEGFYININFDSGLTVSLTGPSGTNITPGLSKSQGGVSILKFELANPAPGSYELAFANSATIDQHAIIETLITGENVPKTGVLVDYGQIEGEPITLSVAVFTGEQAVQNASVSLSLKRGTVQQMALTPLDNGLAANGDYLVGDGLYSTVTTLPAGTYNAIATSTIATTAGPITMTAMQQFTVFEITGKIIGEFSDQGIDRNGDGLLDKVLISAPLESVTRPGKYTLEVILQASNGNKARSRRGMNTLTSSSKTITTEFDADDIRELGVNGPYQILEANFLWSLANPITAPRNHRIQRFTDLGSTQAYQLDQLDRPYLMFERYVSDRGMDTNGNGQFDYIEVTFELNSAFNGNFDFLWKGRLVPEIRLPSRDQEVSGNGRGNIRRGINTIRLSFPVEEYGVNGINGPFYISPFLIHPNNRLPAPYDDVSGNRFEDIPRRIGPTRPYSASDLEGGGKSNIPDPD